MKTERGYSDVQRHEAAEWLVRLRDAQELTDRDLQAWERWFARSAQNRAAFRAVNAVYEQAGLGIDAFPEQREDPDDYDPAIPVAAWRMRKSAKVARRVPWLAAASVATVIVGAAAAFYFLNDGFPFARVVTAGEFITRIGEHRELRLADGSRITLGARSRLSVDLTPTARKVQLKAGEAFFSVHREAQRPFTVTALDGLITAVGTSFNVRATRDRVTVAVTEGLVKVSDEGTQAVQVAKGEQLVFTSGATLPASRTAVVTSLHAEEAARWREGWLIYRDEPLRYVVADIARYSNLRLKVPDSIAGELRFTGAISKDDVAEWILALPEIFPVIVQSDGTDMIIMPRLPIAGRSSS